ncbi:DUF2811 domain-containing protein [Synechococcus sp. NOUM97013]|uniref:DUF2811 domain-containing protein n=1 Tax=Synechococcus sp. NOUM97013 TaxID=1442555 RepID=UPI001648BAC5|nr:DUF2811 domain-containing protein [Synechococcus sp. NOUM97013]QNI74384.1 conserved hypothetical protein (DUF2811) [Synechococcus sp. NOUM97013]
MQGIGQFQASQSKASTPVQTHQFRVSSAETSPPEESVVSFHSELPQPLQQAMVSFIERCPNWDQYRLVQAALAGFLIQNGVESREITRLYVGNMFRRDSLTQGV